MPSEAGQMPSKAAQVTKHQSVTWGCRRHGGCSLVMYELDVNMMAVSCLLQRAEQPQGML